MAKWDEDQFEVSLGRLRSPSGSRRAVGFFEQVTRGARANRKKAAYRNSSASTVKAMTFQRRVIVKASIKRLSGSGYAAFRKHLDYIQRDGTDEDGKRADVYGRGVEDINLPDDLHEDISEAGQSPQESIDSQKNAMRAFAKSCKDDRHHFRFIVSPEDGQKLLDLKGYTRDLVARMEHDLDTKLKWVATNHYDTGQPHTHLIIRGVRDNGKDLLIPKKYIAYTLRERAQELVYEELGPVSQMEGRVRMAQAIQAKGATELDTSLNNKIEDGIIDMSGPAAKGRVWHRQLQVRRLRVLEKMGLAEVSDDETFETLKTGQIVTFQPHQLGARKIDHSIEAFAKNMDLNDAAQKLSETVNKPYAALGASRVVEGIYREAIERPSGKFAVIERARDFTLVPWRPVMDRNLGKSLSGRISGGGISWDVTKQRGISR